MNGLDGRSPIFFYDIKPFFDKSCTYVKGPYLTTYICSNAHTSINRFEMTLLYLEYITLSKSKYLLEFSLVSLQIHSLLLISKETLCELN